MMICRRYCQGSDNKCSEYQSEVSVQTTLYAIFYWSSELKLIPTLQSGDFMFHCWRWDVSNHKEFKWSIQNYYKYFICSSCWTINIAVNNMKFLECIITWPNKSVWTNMRWLWSVTIPVRAKSDNCDHFKKKKKTV